MFRRLWRILWQGYKDVDLQNFDFTSLKNAVSHTIVISYQRQWQRSLPVVELHPFAGRDRLLVALGFGGWTIPNIV